MKKNFFLLVWDSIVAHWRGIVCTILIIMFALATFAGGFYLCHYLTKEVAVMWKTIALAPEPEKCSLCEVGINHHAPCLINISSGKLVELAVYEPHPEKIGEISDELSTGFISFNYGAGTNTVRNPGTETCKATLPKEIEPLNAAHFCYECRRKIADTAYEGYVLADMYNLDNITIYKVDDGATYTIRDYLVTVRLDENRYTVVETHGLLGLCE